MSTTEAESQAAASLAGLIVEDFAKKGGYEHIPAVAEAASTPEPVAATSPVVSSTPTPAAAAAVETPAPAEVAAPTDIPSFEPTIPDELQELLDTPDFEEEAAAEVAIEAEEDEFLDTDAAKKQRALEKRNAWLEQQLVQRSRGNWVAENLRAYPLLREYAKAEVEAIDATSRRSFARKASALNAQLEQIAKPMLADIASLKESLKTEAIQEGKQEAKQRWGNVPGDVAGASAGDQQAARLAVAEQNAEKTGSLRETFRVMLEQNPLV